MFNAIAPAIVDAIMGAILSAIPSAGQGGNTPTPGFSFLQDTTFADLTDTKNNLIEVRT